MRWHILRALLHKEALRHVANRGGIVLALLLLGMAMLLSFGKTSSQNGLMPAEVQACYIIVWKEDLRNQEYLNWLDYLHDHIPAEWKRQLQFRHADQFPQDSHGRILLEGTTGSIQLHPVPPTSPGGKQSYSVHFWHPGEDPNILAPYEAWFWRETRTYFQATPQIVEKRERLAGSADTRSLLATALALFALFLPCMYLLPSMTCEERERGVMLAQALSPASPLEIIASKFVFYPLAGITLAATIAGVYHPAALLTVFFWVTLFALAIGWLGIGMTIASLARTQRLASLGSMCYLIILCLYMLTVQQTRFTPLMWILIEYHSPMVLQHALSDSVEWFHWIHLVGIIFLATAWSTIAVILFRNRGWQ
jgi:hypothetical protein